MDQKLSLADIQGMFESVGVSPIDRDKDDLRELMHRNERNDDGSVVYRTVLSNGTGKSVQGGTDAEFERNTAGTAG